ncbi:hypothetical protein [Sphingomonas sp. ERG5]|uniref:hypothetical protein n=1 Tax=Sphingomonas sp. ERG5 TaxID=1381597 RepID=UPI00054B4F11|nr:hypothetical protein [Sphingomonas sp. ERG5]
MKAFQIMAVMAASVIAVSATPASAAKVGDACRTSKGEPGHFVATRAAGIPTIKCKADARTAVDSGPDAFDGDETPFTAQPTEPSAAATPDGFAAATAAQRVNSMAMLARGDAVDQAGQVEAARPRIPRRRTPKCGGIIRCPRW